MTYGDILVPASNYAGMIQTFEQTKSRAILGLNWIDDPYKGAAVYLGPDNRVERIIEKPPKGTSTTNWNNAGMYVFDPVIFEYTARLRPSARGSMSCPMPSRPCFLTGSTSGDIPSRDIGATSVRRKMWKPHKSCLRKNRP